MLSSFPYEKQQNKTKKHNQGFKKGTISHNSLAGGVTMETCSLKKTAYFFNVNWRVEFGVGQFIVFFRTCVEGWVCGGSVWESTKVLDFKAPRERSTWLFVMGN
jgi:hypothetical protein